MKFYAPKKRNPTIIIVSLIDILAILLIFFIVTTTFKKKQQQLQINLPESRTAAPAEASSVAPLLLRVKDAEQIFLGPDAVALADLPSRLKTAVASEPSRPIAMQADREAPFGVVVQVLDALKDAGIKNIPAFTDPKSKSTPP